VGGNPEECKDSLWAVEPIMMRIIMLLLLLLSSSSNYMFYKVQRVTRIRRQVRHVRSFTSQYSVMNLVFTEVSLLGNVTGFQPVMGCVRRMVVF
jgi:hypothetical protein